MSLSFGKKPQGDRQSTELLFRTYSGFVSYAVKNATVLKMIEAHPLRVVVYLCHGSQKFFDQTIYSAMTLLDLVVKQSRSDYRIHIYTDRADAFPRHEAIRVMKLSNQEIETHKGPLEYVHRVKLAVLKRAVAGDEHALYIYVDCDTRWQKLPDSAFSLLNAAPGIRINCLFLRR